MLKSPKFYFILVVLFEELRKKCGMSIIRLCSDSSVSTRTYAKFVKKIPIRYDCCIRLFIGICKGATKEEIRDFLLKLLDYLYDYFSEYDIKRA